MNVFVLPIALGGLLLGLPAAQADTFVLSLPLEAGQPALAGSSSSAASRRGPGW